MHAGDFVDSQTGFAGVARKLGGTDEARVIVRPFGQQVKEILGANHGKQVGLRITVDGGKKYRTARLHQCCTGAHGAGRVGHMLEHFHAGDDIESARHLACEVFGRNLAVIDPESRFVEMQARYAKRLFREVDAGDDGAATGHGFSQDAAAAADIEDMFAQQAGVTVDPFQAQRIDVVQGAEFGVRIPPAVGQIAEFGEFLRVYVGGGIGHIGLHDELRAKKKPCIAGLSYT